ncbi:hypothetical protein IWQ60_010711, partial [Tieghemiomyces parasiticus]
MLPSTDLSKLIHVVSAPLRRLAVKELTDDHDDSTTRHGHQSELVDSLNQLRSFTEYNARDFTTVVDHFRKLCFIRPVLTLQRMLIECITKPPVASTLFAVMHELGYTNCTGHCSRGSADSLTQVNIPVLLHAFQCLFCDQYPDNPGVLEALADFAVRSLDPPADLPILTILTTGPASGVVKLAAHRDRLLIVAAKVLDILWQHEPQR